MNIIKAKKLLRNVGKHVFKVTKNYIRTNDDASLPFCRAPVDDEIINVAESLVNSMEESLGKGMEELDSLEYISLEVIEYKIDRFINERSNKLSVAFFHGFDEQVKKKMATAITLAFQIKQMPLYAYYDEIWDRNSSQNKIFKLRGSGIFFTHKGWDKGILPNGDEAY